MPRNPANHDSVRKAQLARIHASAKQLGMDRDTYEDMIEAIAGKGIRSAGDLDAAGLRQVLDHLTHISGGTPYKGKPHNMAQLPGEIEKIEAMLADMGLSWAYADAIAKRQWGIPRIAWVRDAEKVRAILAALAVEQEKRRRLASVDELLKLLGQDRAWLEQTLWNGTAPRGWQRNRKTLKAVIDWLVPQVPEHGHKTQTEEHQ